MGDIIFTEPLKNTKIDKGILDTWIKSDHQLEESFGSHVQVE